MTCRRAALRLAVPTAVCALLAVAGAASAQVPGTLPPAIDAPWYVGATQGFGYDSNVARAPGGEGGAWSSTGLLAGFDQKLGRQRVYGRAGVTLNRYFDQSAYDNTGYNLLTGLAWETVQNLSGTLEAGLENRRVRPAVADGSDNERNLERTQRFQGVARWGGMSLLTLEGSLGHARIDPSSQAYAAQESRATAGSLGLYWNPGGALRLGVVGRRDVVRWPVAFDDGSGNAEGDRVRSQAVELAATWDDGGVVAGRARLGHARSTRSGAAFDRTEFSGVTGSLAVDVRATGKLTFRGFAARDPNLNPLTPTPAVATTSPPASGGPGGAAPLEPIYQRNVVTTTVGGAAEWQATAKIAASLRLQHAKARLVGLAVDGADAGTDSRQTASLGVRYEVTRAIGLGCAYEHERRRMTGPFAAAYSANAVGCTAGLLLR